MTAKPSAHHRTGDRELCQVLQQQLDCSIPLVSAMQLKVAGIDALGLKLRAPLPPNMNLHGTAFGGSLSAILTLAGWCQMWVSMRRSSVHGELLIHRSEACYHLPVTGAIEAYCPTPPLPQWQKFVRQLQKKGKARMRLRPVILDGSGQEAVTFDSDYVAITREP